MRFAARKNGLMRCFQDKSLAKNELRAIVESFGSRRFAIGAIRSDLGVGGTSDTSTALGGLDQG
jgi:hypothetical protein